ncbi:hypothetical protein [Bradyrhizobium liaoningense]
MLSGGQQQMLAVCRALMSKPRLLLDEPSLGLSPKLTDEVLWRIPEIAKAGTAVVLAEQSLTKALEVTDRAYVLRVGTLVLQGVSSELRSNPSVRKTSSVGFKQDQASHECYRTPASPTLRARILAEGRAATNDPRHPAGRRALTERDQHAAMAGLCPDRGGEGPTGSGSSRQA